MDRPASDDAARTTGGPGRSEVSLAACSLRVTTMPVEESLNRIVGVLRRTGWSLRELHHHGELDRHEVELRATKSAGRIDDLVLRLQREVIVIDVVPMPDGIGCAGTGPLGPR